MGINCLSLLNNLPTIDAGKHHGNSERGMKEFHKQFVNPMRLMQCPDS